MGKLNKVPSRLQQVTGSRCQVASDSWRENKTSAQRGYGYKWQQYRLEYLKAHRYCRMCLQSYGLAGYTTNAEVEAKLNAYQLDAVKANVVDHIQAHQGDMDLFWDESNHQPLCKFHHDSTKQREERLGRGWG